ncbi:hypothetical protein E2R51_18105 [Jeotgalibacillus sp. S-D1]|uniref:hypothetical protein n=1 Tax=Jeotgalibacillus sp. S-D1 TaxID=2552189 RepID=UPI001059EFAC|nr:hypothetical protein [Jeotgalibacillus sp. S-D1]TDL30453.1 hypothetical protein E2R51_18105 [Jeotgalibacillus sp. S-D1]
MEILVQALMESLHEGTVPFAYILLLIWSWNCPLTLEGISSKWSGNKGTLPIADQVVTNNLRAVEAICSRMIFGKTIKRKDCPDDSDEAASPLFLLN